MQFLSSLISPITSAFFVIIIGYYIGRIKIHWFSLDLAGILIVAVAAGYLISLGETFDMYAVCVQKQKVTRRI